jgi:hypothetical protein
MGPNSRRVKKKRNFLFIKKNKWVILFSRQKRNRLILKKKYFLIKKKLKIFFSNKIEKNLIKNNKFIFL